MTNLWKASNRGAVGLGLILIQSKLYFPGGGRAFGIAPCYHLTLEDSSSCPFFVCLLALEVISIIEKSSASMNPKLRRDKPTV